MAAFREKKIKKHKKKTILPNCMSVWGKTALYIIVIFFKRRLDITEEEEAVYFYFFELITFFTFAKKDSKIVFIEE